MYNPSAVSSKALTTSSTSDPVTAADAGAAADSKRKVSINTAAQ